MFQLFKRSKTNITNVFLLSFKCSNKIILIAKNDESNTFQDGFQPITQAKKVRIAIFFQNSNSPYLIYQENMFFIKKILKKNFFEFLALFQFFRAIILVKRRQQNSNTHLFLLRGSKRTFSLVDINFWQIPTKFYASPKKPKLALF